MRVLLTGATGMVGQNILNNPSVLEHEILTPSRQELDLRDYGGIRYYLKETQPDMIIHAAGTVGGIQANVKEPVRFLVDNLDIGRNLIIAARDTGISKLLNIASSCMYPRDVINPLKEEFILMGQLEPTNEGYALAKIMATRLCQYINREDETYTYKTIVPCNLYGKWDKFDPSTSHMVPAVIRKIHEAKQNSSPVVEIWGDGTVRREFMYAGDLADFVGKALSGFDSMPEIMNVGLGEDLSILEYYQAIAEVVGYHGSFEFNLDKPVGMQRKVVDVTRQRRWGWMPKMTLFEGVSQTYEFFLNGGK